jgi:4-aminobutyrate aminotransferase-like enzyme
VLDVIEDERLRENARDVGARLLGGLRELADRHLPIGDVRGMGLFIGIEIVSDRETREPDGDLASEIVEAAKDRGVLLSTDGRDHNVLKIKPPLVFSAADADRVCETLDAVVAGRA